MKLFFHAGDAHVFLAAVAAVFLAGEKHGADRVARLVADGLEQAEDFDGLDDAGTVVVRAGRDVPRIEMATDEDNLFRKLGALDFADDVVRGRVGEPRRGRAPVGER